MKTPTPFTSPIYVTKPFLPPLQDFCKGLEGIWDSGWLTNNGPIHERFLKRLSEHFQTSNLCLFTNGTLALQIGIQGMGISGEVITTPFTFVATTHALFWNKVRPVFCDIEPDYFTLDPQKVEEAITPWTTAILGVHVFGNPCNLDKLAAIARRHNLRLLYDAAHAFGVKVADKPIAHFGDLSMFSFHATKLYHSFEGGLLSFQDAGLKTLFDYLKNFGFKNQVEVVMPGTNAKMNEIQALMGLLMLDYLERLIEKRKSILLHYRQRLLAVPGLRFSPLPGANIKANYAYVPVEVDAEEFGMSRDDLYGKLKEFNVFTRRYFYPLICDFACYKAVPLTDPLTVARGVASRILNLPIYDSLDSESVDRICDMIEYLHFKSRRRVPEITDEAAAAAQLQ